MLLFLHFTSHHADDKLIRLYLYNCYNTPITSFLALLSCKIFAVAHILNHRVVNQTFIHELKDYLNVNSVKTRA